MNRKGGLTIKNRQLHSFIIGTTGEQINNLHPTKITRLKRRKDKTKI
jgi:hypothetical protein